MKTFRFVPFSLAASLTALLALDALQPAPAGADRLAQAQREQPFSGPKLYSNLQCTVRLEDPSGNDSLDPGEEAKLILRVTNEGQGPARRIRAVVNANPSFDDVGVVVPPVLGDLGPSQTREYAVLLRGGKKMLDHRMNLSIYVMDTYGFKSPTVNFGLETRATINAELRPVQRHAYAVVVGIENYAQAGIPRAWYAQRDAAAVARYLTYALGVPSDHVMLLRNEQATKATLRIKFEGRLPKILSHPDAKLYVYFSGHGIVDPETRNAALVAYDADLAYPKFSCYALPDIYHALQRIGRPTVMFLDTSFGGSSARGDRPVPLPHAGSAPSFNVASRTPPDNVSVLFAASGRELNAALPRKQHGLFTYHLLQGLGNARNVPALRETLYQQMQHETQATHGPQTPDFFGNPSLPL